VTTLSKLSNDPKLPQNVGPISLHDGQTLRQSYSINNPKARRREVATYMSILLLCPSQHDTSIYEAYGPRELECQ